ncbi:hypothetical protein DFH08DRAFT_871594 [Mycena albidolilacea]|uniref:Uncharacterized protein n=1 Tax=Mycena albidolilacea TaxID=1033008 RepID=A0AAD6ZZL9_9AGAR|nr:hypothetical protein DFH08DRAFT_871594 [Mycena albidolilacea]
MSKPDISAHLKGWDGPVYHGTPQENVELWISTIRYGLKQRRLPREHWGAVALHFMSDEPRTVLKEAQREMGIEWDWERLTAALVHIEKQVKKEAFENNDSNSVGDSLRRFRREHPFAAGAAAVGLITVGGITVAPAILVGTLNLLGFSASGVVGGSIAASIQSAFYGGAVASGSLFSLAQSAAAGGIAVAALPIQAVSAGAVGLGAWLFKKRENGSGSDNSDASASSDDGRASISGTMRDDDDDGTTSSDGILCEDT